MFVSRDEFNPSITLNNDGVLLMESGKYKDAARHFKKASKLMSQVLSSYYRNPIQRVEGASSSSSSISSSNVDIEEEFVNDVEFYNNYEESKNEICLTNNNTTVTTSDDDDDKSITMTMLTESILPESVRQCDYFLEESSSSLSPDLSNGIERRNSIKTMRKSMEVLYENKEEENILGRAMRIEDGDENDDELDDATISTILYDSCVVRVSGTILYNLGLAFHFLAEKRKMKKKEGFLYYYSKALQIYGRCSTITQHSLKRKCGSHEQQTDENNASATTKNNNEFQFAFLALQNMIYINYDEFHDHLKAQQCLIDLIYMVRVCCYSNDSDSDETTTKYKLLEKSMHSRTENLALIV
mmetsp:Transcript_39427/g.43602  ORF Transcript_39427/g.43602 Transcript_39427/m.43602 type:complete len:356 (-) Transcript_39427:47-1114(-)